MQRLFVRLVVFLSCLTIPALSGVAWVLIAVPSLAGEPKAEVALDKGNAFYSNGDLDAAIAAYDEAIRLNPKYAKAFCDRGSAYVCKRQYEKAIDDYTKAIRLNPELAEAYCGRGVIFGYFGLNGEFDKGIADFTEVIHLNPKLAAPYYGRGAAYMHKGEYDRAIRDFDEALQLVSSNDISNMSLVYCNRGVVWGLKGEYDKAIADFSQAVAVNPKDVASYVALARIEATCLDEKYRDGKQAVENANKAYQLSGGKRGSYLATLAAAYAESGDFEKAKEWQAKAIELAGNDKSLTEKDRQEMRDCLELYKQGKPYHVGPPKKKP